MKTRSCLLALFSLFWWLHAPHAAEPARSRPPNIVLILADDLGRAELGCYGQTKIQTPHIDRLAHEGMRFTQCYSGSQVCAPSRSALITGLHTGHTPIRANGGYHYLYDEDITIAEVLKPAGYVSGGFGKWGLGTEKSSGFPLKQGFDEWFGFYHQVHAHFHYPFFLWQNDKEFFLLENKGHQRTRYAHDEIHKKALKFLRTHRNDPFFCYIPYTLPHVELTVPDDSLKPYHGKWDETPLPDSRAGYIGAEEPYATHAAMVSRLDRSVGDIIAMLKQLQIDTNTLVLFSSDNGPQAGHWKRVADFFEANGNLRGYKGQFYEGGIRVPLIAWWPGRIAAGSTSDHVCAFWDFLPTFADLASVAPPKNIDGLSFLPTLLGRGNQKTHPFLYWEIDKANNQAIRMGRWKALRQKGKIELYDLEKDAAETTDVAPQNPEVVQRITRLMETEHSEERNYPQEKQARKPEDYVK
jgi:arylsulfatase A